jgi:YggT family protein
MIILANFLNATAVVLGMVLNTLIVIMVIRMVLSWANPDPYNPFVRFITGVTDPLLQLVRPLSKYINPRNSRIDFSPLALFMILVFLNYFLVQVLHDYAFELRH